MSASSQNSVVERVFHEDCRTPIEAKQDVFEYIEMFYNRRRSVTLPGLPSKSCRPESVVGIRKTQPSSRTVKINGRRFLKQNLLHECSALFLLLSRSLIRKQRFENLAAIHTKARMRASAISIRAWKNMPLSDRIGFRVLWMGILTYLFKLLPDVSQGVPENFAYI
jgi:hypothetical protein